MDTSLFKPYSIGYVAENKPRNDSVCYIVPVEARTAIDGAVDVDPVVEDQKWNDAEGRQNETKTTSSNTLACHWLPIESNRLTPPDVVKGEKVIIYRSADDDNGYYWTTTGLNSDLRMEETVIWMVGATKSTSGYGKDFSKAYSLVFSGHDKHITLMTSKANGEPFKYTFQFNTKEGEFVLTDDINNYFHLDSQEKCWTLKNADGTIYQLDKRKIYGMADEEIKFVCGGSSFTMVPQEIKSVTGGSSHTLTPTMIDSTTGASTINLTPSAITIISPTLMAQITGVTTWRTADFAII